MSASRPTPWDVAWTMYGWSGDAQDLEYIIHTDEITIIPGPQTSGRVPRAELTPRLAMQNRKVYGFLSEILESDQMLNTETRYRFVTVVQIVYYKGPGDTSQDSWMWVKTNAFSSNALLTDPCGVMVGPIVTGALPPTFGTHLATQLGSWAVSDCRGWKLNGLGGAHRPHYFDIDPETTDHLPTLGGSAFDLTRLRYAIAGVRLRPPSAGPHLFHRELAASKDMNGEKQRRRGWTPEVSMTASTAKPPMTCTGKSTGKKKGANRPLSKPAGLILAEGATPGADPPTHARGTWNIRT